MTKEELSGLLHASCDAVNEGITSKKNENTYPRVLYWSYVWEDSLASGDAYQELHTYQVSMFATVPPEANANLIKLRTLLRKKGVHPTIYHEYNEEDHVWHSYMSVQVDCGVIEE